MIWVHADLYQCTLFSRFFLGLTENSSIGFQWGVFHLRQSSLPFPTRSPFDAGYLFWDPTFQHVVWSEIYCGGFVRRGLKAQQWWRRCADATVLCCSLFATRCIITPKELKFKLFSIIFWNRQFKVKVHDVRTFQLRPEIMSACSRCLLFHAFCCGNDLVWHSSCRSHPNVSFHQSLFLLL